MNCEFINFTSIMPIKTIFCQKNHDNGSSIIAQINCKSAKDGISCVLLQSRSSPPSKFAGLPVIKILFSIIVSVPKRIGAEDRTTLSISYNLIPHICTRIKTNSSSSRFNCSHKFLHKLTVRLWSSLIPCAPWTRVSFNIEPNGSCLVVVDWCSILSHHLVEIIDQLVDLSCCIFAPARKHVHIGWKTCLVGLKNVIWCI